MHSSLRSVMHRPWPLPGGPWIMAQNWHDLLFAHWPVPADAIERLLPANLELEIYGGQAWISIVPFTMSGVRLRGTPPLPWLSAFPELNVRTYVARGGKPGVWFFSLDAANPVAVEIARRWFHLPYFRGRMSSHSVSGEIVYSCKRKDRRGGYGQLEATFRAHGERFEARSGTLEYFLTERYCLYARRPDGKLLRGEIHHAPWKLREAHASFTVNTISESLAAKVSGPPAVVHFSKLQQVIVWRPEVVCD